MFGSAAGSPSYEAPAPMSADQKALIDKENHFRHLFAEDPSNAELKDAHLLLENVFDHESEYFFQDESEDEKRVPKVLTQCRKLGLTGKAIVSSNEFTTRWTNFTNGVLNGLDWNHVFCAGGAILANLIADNTGYQSSDIDLFLYGLDTDEEANAKLREIHALVVRNTGSKGDVIRTARAVTILNTYPYRHVQVVLRAYKSPAEVLLGFDIDSCTVGYDGRSIYCMERFKRALTKRYNLVNISRRSLTYEQRLYKYSRRGFAVAVPNLDKSKVNPEIFQKRIKDLFGLSKLLLYDYLAQQNIHRARSAQVPGGFNGDNNRRIEMQESSDYNGELEIPWGANYTAKGIMNILNLRDKRQFFGQLNKMKKQSKEGGNFGNTSSSTSSKKPEHLFERIFLDTTDANGNTTKKIEWIRNNPAYQDLDGEFTRPLMTGSFQLPPPVQAIWDEQSYTPSATHPTGLSVDQGYVPGSSAPVPQQAQPSIFGSFGASPAHKKAAVPLPSNQNTRGGFVTSTSAFEGAGGSTAAVDISKFGGPSNASAGFTFGSTTAASPKAGVSFSPNKFSVASQPTTAKATSAAQPSSSSSWTFGTAFTPASSSATPSAAAPVSSTIASAAISNDLLNALIKELASLRGLIVSQSKTSASSLSHAAGQEEAPPTTKLLLLISLCFKQGNITAEEKSTLKDLVIERHEAIYSALEVFEVDQDLEDLVDTFKKVVKSRNNASSSH